MKGRFEVVSCSTLYYIQSRDSLDYLQVTSNPLNQNDKRYLIRQKVIGGSLRLILTGF